MPSYQEKREIACAPQRVYKVVADVQKYPHFLPWCHRLEVYEKGKDSLKAILGLEVGGYKESFHSKVTFTPGKKIVIEHIKEGPLDSLKSVWQFSEGKGGAETCLVDFSIVFSFRNFLLNILLRGAMERVTEKMVAAFEDRVHTLYKKKEVARKK